MLKLLVFLCIILNIMAMYILTKIKILNKSFFRFILTGGLNTFDYYLVYLFLYQTFNLNYLPSHLISFLTSAFISFFVTTWYTFGSNITLEKAIKFPITFLPNLIISTTFTVFLVKFNLVGETYASLLSMIIAIPITFLISKKIILNKSQFYMEKK